MQTTITVTPIEEEKNSDTFRVFINDGSGTSTHDVTVTDEARVKLCGAAATKEKLLKRSFEFLLEQEPKESILSSFAIELISTYFPEYPEEIRNRCIDK